MGLDCPGTVRCKAQQPAGSCRKRRAKINERAQGAGGSLGGRRDFRLQQPPCRLRQGLEELADEVPRSDVVARRKVAVVALPAREGAEARVVLVSCDFAEPSNVSFDVFLGLMRLTRMPRRCAMSVAISCTAFAFQR